MCFTIPEKDIVEFEKNINVQVTCIGEIEKESGVRCIKNDTEINISEIGYQHFTND